ncbi:unnamed protein product [Albugo candida]|uniref:Reverse transcriptase RNase H-like domain-containing protein n=1 Tax=Albugo candida TaxID=65357 RepID=A0A024FWA0_9STRA|nr:unnamed protein product [Albugo candida]|eukprot:CCI11316.1 unnamed protein product [Albugo candida]
MVPMAHPKGYWEVCVYKDAFKDHWGEIVTQVAPEELEPLSEQVHVPLASISGSCKGAAASWSTVEKECLVIVETCKRLEEADIFQVYCLGGLKPLPTLPGIELTTSGRGSVR